MTETPAAAGYGRSSRQRRRGEALHVLDDERARTGLAHGAHRLQKQVALVRKAVVLAAYGKGLAGRYLQSVLLKKIEPLAVTIEV